MAVFCGSKPGNNPNYVQQAILLSNILAAEGIDVIYGGGNKGLMGAVANATLDNGGKVIGIIPELLKEQEHLHTTLTQTFIVADMHNRKKMLYEKCDAAIILPGGYGTLDELFEILTWNQLKIHEKKIFFLNTDGFYNHLIAHITSMYEQGFLYNPPTEQMIVLNNPEEILLYLTNEIEN